MTTFHTTTIADLLPAAAARFSDDAALSFKRDGRRVNLTYGELANVVGQIGLGLVDLGLERGDRVAILCDTRPEWAYAQLAVTTAGGVVVPIYPSSSPSECQWVLENSEAKMVICENASQLAKITEARDGLPKLERLIVIEPGPSDAVAWDQLPRAGDAQQWWSRAATVYPEDAFAIVYTSGTTGRPKGCVLSHRNVRATVDAMAELSIRHGESTYLFLPLAHVFSLLLELLCISVGGRLAFWGGDPARIFEEIQEIAPSYFPAVPRIFEKIYARFAPALRERLGEERFAELVSLGCEVRAALYAGRDVARERYEEWKAADEQVFAGVRKVFGGKIRQAATGAAPITREILEFFYAAGVPVLEGYGMTETATAITMSTPEHWKFGTVGRPLPHVEVRLGDDNEILVKGANVFDGYYNDARATAATIVDGWLHTGDLGSFDDEGYLSITGRKKDLIITAGGKNIAPSRIEHDVARSRYISQAVLHGDRRPYLVMLITLDPVEIAQWARERGKNDDLSELAEDPDVISLVQAAVDEANENHARAAQVKKFFLLDRELSTQEGELTQTLKVKRMAVNERFATQFDRLYDRP
jgi:long-chain acyl-CoA synthetase